MNTSVFNIPIGRIGVVIFFDTTKTHTMYSLMEERPEILLIPYSCPHFPSYFPKKDRESWLEVFLNTPKVYAQYLNAPVVSSNKTGRFTSPLPGMSGLKAEMDFISESAIVDKNGNAVSSISEEAGALVEQVELGDTSISVKKGSDCKGPLAFCIHLENQTDYGYLPETWSDQISREQEKKESLQDWVQRPWPDIV